MSVVDFPSQEIPLILMARQEDATAPKEEEEIEFVDILNVVQNLFVSRIQTSAYNRFRSYLDQPRRVFVARCSRCSKHRLLPNMIDPGGLHFARTCLTMKRQCSEPNEHPGPATEPQYLPGSFVIVLNPLSLEFEPAIVEFSHDASGDYVMISHDEKGVPVRIAYFVTFLTHRDRGPTGGWFPTESMKPLKYPIPTKITSKTVLEAFRECRPYECYSLRDRLFHYSVMLPMLRVKRDPLADDLSDDELIEADDLSDDDLIATEGVES
ncbi:uncharacterized protein LOC100897937 [Galendromus occidentalis]|uniref:Uncharacterized protein LOC100897937 n=1 Tax=Galendromus occidentalis TaxID=34638 RepID=A0AAJ6QXV5_9ACAR|nr:uncharacterized protein LOC100897937 [Galendromus occidentalis]